MYRYIGVLFALLLALNLSASTHNLDSVLKVLDQVVENRYLYSAKKDQAITTLKQQLAHAGASEQRFQITGHLFNLYSNYQVDSAYHIAQERVKLALSIGREKELADSQMNLAEVYRTTGMYKEAIEVLQKLESEGWYKEDLSYYYHLNHSLYMLMADYALLDEEKRAYNHLVFNYKDSLLNVLDQSRLSYYLVKSSKQLMMGEYQQALKIMQEAYDRFGGDSPMLTYTLSEIYHSLGNREEEKYYLACSAVSDLKQGVKEYISLRKLAILLHAEGQVDRAYNYMKCAMEDAVFSNSRLRTLEVSKMLPLINEAYDVKVERERGRLLAMLTVIIILSGVLLGLIFLTVKQVRELSTIRVEQREMYAELEEVNQRLNELNALLSDANVVKEEYIGYLFNICSSYIGKLEDFRLLVHRNLKTGQVKQLSRMVGSSSLVADELKEFYRDFDSVFLKIYPNFVEEFNALLQEGEKIYPKEGDLLTPELRIYALVRLGINDSVKIAEFLHYSPQTIYNYRLKVRNKSWLPKEDFVQEVSKLGRV